MSDDKTVHAAWADVMAEVRELGKDQRNSQQGFNFRGVDDVMNAVGPVLRRHRVSVIPSGVETAMRDVQTSNGKPQREATVRVTYTIIGPDGSTLIGAAAGESADSGDKATPKAMSVAYRTFLLQSLCLPTHDTDPDQHVMERGSGPTAGELAQQTADRLADTTDLETVTRVQAWADEKRLMDEPVTDAAGNSLTLGQLFGSVVTTLQGATA